MQEMGKPSKGQARSNPEEAVKCPRCESSNTKFCYYNNNSQSQPRYLCKSCRRFWTKGGTLRNVPVGGGCRKNKKSSSSSSSSSKRIQDQTLKPNTNPIDTTNDLTLNFARLQQQYDHHDSDHLSCLGNPSLNVAGSVADPVFLGNFNGFQGLAYGFGNDTFGEVVNGVGFNGETMILYNNEDMIDSTLMTTTTTTTTTSDVTVATMKQDGPDNRSDLWDLPWQLIEDDGNNNYNNRAVGCDLDSVIDNWYGAI